MSPGNRSSLGQPISQIDAAFAGDGRFFILLKALEHLGGANDQLFTVYDTQAAKAAAAELIGERSKETTGRTSIRLAGEDTPICYASKPNSLMIRANGRIGKCTVALYDDRNDVGSLHDDGTVQVDQNRFRLWVRGFSSGNPVELACPYSTMDSTAATDTD